MYNYTIEVLNKEVTSSVYPDEWEVLINASQLELVQNKYNEIDAFQKRIDDLRVLVVGPDVINNSGTNTPGGEIFSLPYIQNPLPGGSHGYMFMLSVAIRRTTTNGLCDTNEWIKAKPLKRDKRYEIEKDPWNKPSINRIYYFLSSNNMKVSMGDGAIASQARIEYLRYPINISLSSNTTSELPAHMHKEICDLAARKYLEQTESPRYNTNFQENQTTNN